MFPHWLHFLHQLVYLLFGVAFCAESNFLQWLENNDGQSTESEPNSKVAGRKTKTIT